MTQTQFNPLSTGLFLHLLFNPIEIFTTFTDFENWSIIYTFTDLENWGKCLKNFENEKFFLCLKIAEIDMGVNFGLRRTILDIKTHFLNVKPVFWG